MIVSQAGSTSPKKPIGGIETPKLTSGALFESIKKITGKDVTGIRMSAGTLRFRGRDMSFEKMGYPGSVGFGGRSYEFTYKDQKGAEKTGHVEMLLAFGFGGRIPSCEPDVDKRLKQLQVEESKLPGTWATVVPFNWHSIPTLPSGLGDRVKGSDLK